MDYPKTCSIFYSELADSLNASDHVEYNYKHDIYNNDENDDHSDGDNDNNNNNNNDDDDDDDNNVNITDNDDDDGNNNNSHGSNVNLAPIGSSPTTKIEGDTTTTTTTNVASTIATHTNGETIITGAVSTSTTATMVGSTTLTTTIVSRISTNMTGSGSTDITTKMIARKKECNDFYRIINDSFVINKFGTAHSRPVIINHDTGTARKIPHQNNTQFGMHSPKEQPLALQFNTNTSNYRKQGEPCSHLRQLVDKTSRTARNNLMRATDRMIDSTRYTGNITG